MMTGRPTCNHGNRRPRGTLRAFTLLELLVAVTITLVLAGLMLAVVTGTLNLWQRTQNKFFAAAQAKLVLDLAERDLQGAIFRTDGGAWLAVDVVNVAGDLGVHGWLTGSAFLKPVAESQRVLPTPVAGQILSIADARFGLSGAWLRFIGANVETNGSMPVAISYQIARRPVSGTVTAINPAEVRYGLFRAAVSIANTLTAGNDVTVGYGSLSTSPLASRNPATITNPNNTDLLATNVVDFGVWLYVKDSSTGSLRQIFPTSNVDLSHRVSDTGAAGDSARFPDVIDVMVRVISDQGAALIAEIESGAGRVVRPSNYASDGEWWWGIVEANSQTYVRRVQMRASGK